MNELQKLCERILRLPSDGKALQMAPSIKEVEALAKAMLWMRRRLIDVEAYERGDFKYFAQDCLRALDEIVREDWV